MEENAIVLQNIEKSYKDFTLGPLSLTLPQGMVLGLVGANGAGKSTLIKTMLGITHPTAGHVEVLGGLPTNPAIRQQIGVVFDDLPVDPVYTATQLGKIYGGIYSQWDEELYGKLLRQLELYSPQQQIKDYSRGMRMKLSIALAMSHHARLLLLDEPTGGLDPIVRSEILDLLRDFMQEEDHSILVSSHITSDLERIADLVAYVDRGLLLLVEEKDTLLEQYGHCKLRREELAIAEGLPLIGLHEEAFGYSALTTDPVSVRRACPQAVIDRAGLDTIMEYIVREARKA